MKRIITMGALNRVPKNALSPKQLQKVRSELTFNIPTSANFSGSSKIDEIQIREYREDPESLYLPRYYPVPTDFRIVDETAEGESAHWKFRMGLISKPQHDQKAAARALYENRGGILAAAPGRGKTIIALAAATKVERRTCVVVPTVTLQDQWIERAMEATTLKREDIGIVQGPTCEWRKPLIVAMLQSLAQRTYPPEFYRSIGVLIVDEFHKVGAEHFIQTLPKFPSRYRWGLSATVERRDGMHVALMYHLGPIVYEMMETDIKPTVYRLITPYSLARRDYTNVWNGEVNLSKLQTSISKIRERNRMLAEQIIKAYDAGRKTLALSRRLEQMEEVRKHIMDLSAKNQKEIDRDTSIINAKTKDRKGLLKFSRNILAIEQIAGFGLDQPDLDTLIYLSPIQNTEQNVGRIEREYPNKKAPLVLDPVDQNEVLQSMARARLRYYESKGYEIHNIRVGR